MDETDNDFLLNFEKTVEIGTIFDVLSKKKNTFDRQFVFFNLHGLRLIQIARSGELRNVTRRDHSRPNTKSNLAKENKNFGVFF